MTDLEMIKKCAEKMGLDLGPEWDQGFVMLGGHSGKPMTLYDPLHDDAQAMALVKKFYLAICRNTPYWDVRHVDGDEPGCDTNLNRAIVECVSRLPD
jgi:hypothetical protein